MNGLLQDGAYAVQLAIGGVFVLSVVPKVRHPAAFVETVANFEVLPVSTARVAAWWAIGAEALLAVCFLTGWMLALAMPLAACVVLVFGAATAVNLRRGRDIPCGCFGDLTERISGHSLIRLGLILAAVILLAILVGSSAAQAITLGDVWGAGSDGLSRFAAATTMATFLLVAATWSLMLHEIRSLLTSGPAADSTTTAAGGSHDRRTSSLP